MPREDVQRATSKHELAVGPNDIMFSLNTNNQQPTYLNLNINRYGFSLIFIFIFPVIGSVCNANIMMPPAGLNDRAGILHISI